MRFSHPFFRRILPAPLLAGFIAFTYAMSASAAVTFIGSAVINGSGNDMSNLFGSLENGIRENVLNGIGSGIAYSGYGNTYYLLSDRGPSNISYKNSGDRDDTTHFQTRFQSFDIVLSGAGSHFTVTATNTGTTLFRNEFGLNLIGASDQFGLGNSPESNRRFDPESIRVAPDGTLYVSDEFGPGVYHFTRNGVRIESLPVPLKFFISRFTYSGRSNNEAASNPNSGRIANKGLEGLAITPDGTKLLATMQAPLAQDGGDNTRRVRFILFDLVELKTDPTAMPKEFLYLLDQDSNFPGMNVSKTSVSDAVAINNDQFLIDEREGGDSGKRAYIINIKDAKNISNESSLAGWTDAMANSMAVTKGSSEFISLKKLTDNKPNGTTPVPAGYLTGIPDNIEGYTFGPDLPDGRHLLLVTNDNDFTTAGGYPNYIMAFAIDPSDLPAYQAEQFPIAQGGFSTTVFDNLGASIGTLTASQTASSMVTGKLILNGKSYVLRGKAGTDGLFTQNFKRKGLSDLVVRLAFAPDLNGFASLSAKITSDPDSYTVGSTVAFTTEPPYYAPILYPYNCKLEGGTGADQPNGTGWCSFNIAKKGSIRGTGRLPDNTPISFGSQLRVDGSIIITASVYSKKGSFTANLNILKDPLGDVSGFYTLTKPATKGKSLFPGGFVLSNNITGGLFWQLEFPHPAIPQARAVFFGGPLQDTVLTQDVTIQGSGKGKSIAPVTVPITLKIGNSGARARGLMTGTFTPPAATGLPRTTFTGVLVGGSNIATGVFAGKTQTGTVTVQPIQPPAAE